MKKKTIIIADKENYNDYIIANYTILTQRLHNNSKHISIQGINIAIAALELEEIYKEVLIVKYGLKDGIYKAKSSEVTKHLSKTFNSNLVPKLLSTAIKELSSSKYQLYYDEEVKDMLNRFADLQGYIPIKVFRYLELYCTISGIKLSEICSKIEPHTLLISEIQKSLKDLKEIEYTVLVLRFGLDGNAPQSLRKIADILYTSNDIINNIFRKALRNMKHSIKNFDIDNIDFKIATLRIEIRKLEKLKESLNTDIDLLASDLNILYLSVRTYNSLKRYGIKTIKEFLDLTTSDLLKIRTLGKKGRQEVINIQQIIS